jgi:hypothetical protein
LTANTTTTAVRVKQNTTHTATIAEVLPPEPF